MEVQGKNKLFTLWKDSFSLKQGGKDCEFIFFIHRLRNSAKQKCNDDFICKKIKIIRNDYFYWISFGFYTNRFARQCEYD